MAPPELQRFLLGLDGPSAFRDWLYAHLEAVESALDPDDHLALLELDFDDPRAVDALATRLERRVLPLPPLEADEKLDDYLVLGDQLQAADDPRGELIMLQASLLESGQQVLTEAELLERHRPSLLGPLADFVERGILELDWHLGFIVRARVVEPAVLESGAIVETLLAHPSGSRLRALSVDAATDWGRYEGFEPVVAALRTPSLLTTLTLDTNDELLHCRIGDAGAILTAQRHLRVVALNGSEIRLGPLPPALMSLIVQSRALGGDAPEQLATAPAPRLERLELWLGPEEPIEPVELVPLLTPERLPVLRHLRLPFARAPEALLEVLLASGLLPRLETLDLSRCHADDASGQRLLRDAASFAHLDRLDLRWNHLSPSAADRIARALPNARLDPQHLPGHTTVRRLDLRGER